jgi:transposase
MKMQTKRHTAEVKAKVVQDTIKGQKTIDEISMEYGVHPTQIAQWEKQVLDELPHIFSRRRAKVEQEDEDLNAAFYHQIGQLKVEDEKPQSQSPKLSSEAFKAYLVEYEQCMQNFRHIYATIWQAGALFAAISAGIIAFASSSNFGHTSDGLSPLIQVLVPIPVIFWYLGIFRPMNRYCEQDNDRLVQIEQLLSESVPGLNMRHFRAFSSSRKDEGFAKRALKFKWLLKPRVVEVVSIFGFILIIIEIYLFWIYYLSHWL